MERNKEYMKSIQDIREAFIHNINFRNGIIQNATENTLMDGLIIDVRWKGNGKRVLSV